MADTLQVEWESLKAAERKLRQATREAERVGGRRGENLTHTMYKLGSFLNDGLCGAIERMRERMRDLDRSFPPDPPSEL